MQKRSEDCQRRARQLSGGRRGKGPVVYWMSRDQRVRDNWALCWAQQEARAENRAVVVVFCLVPDYPGADVRAYRFMLGGLRELADDLARYNIGFHLLPGSPIDLLPDFLKQVDACTLVTDFDPLRVKRAWKQRIISLCRQPVVEVDAHNIIPAWLVSEKKEYGAYTLRPKIRRLLDDFLTDIPRPEIHQVPCPSFGNDFDAERFLARVPGRRALPATGPKPGETAGMLALQRALSERLPRYGRDRNDPCTQAQSGLSPYLHFGHLGAQRVAAEVRRAPLEAGDRDAFLEELVVRKELADNFCLYEPNYDTWDGFPEWARKTLDEHRPDRRTHLYTLAEFEEARTHEQLWNACQRDLVISGKLHGYLRMYWAKKILEWTPAPEVALEYAIVLNDRYSLDGRDPNGYAGIAWAIGGVHDRAWRERPVFGKIRYMNENGCRRKFDVDGYLKSVPQVIG